MRAAFSLLSLCLAWTVTGCGSVDVPETRLYRLDWPEPAVGAQPQAGVLRVAELELAADLQGDRILVARGPVQRQAYEFERWAGPLDRLIQDHLRTGLTRSGVFAEVKGTAARGGQDLRLSGKVLDFHLGVDEQGWAGVATLELCLTDTRTGRTLFRREFAARERAAQPRVEDAILALSEGLAGIEDQFLAACEEADVFRPVAASPWR